MMLGGESAIEAGEARDSGDLHASGEETANDQGEAGKD